MSWFRRVRWVFAALFWVELACASLAAQNSSPALLDRTTLADEAAHAARAALPALRTSLPSGAEDMGPVEGGTAIRRMQLLLSRSPQQERALAEMLDAQQRRGTPEYHLWLTPAEFGARFGPPETELAGIAAWLSEAGFTEIRVNAGRTVVEFSGSAAAVKGAFGLSMHRVALAGQSGFAAMGVPTIPSSLAGLVRGLVSLDNLPASGRAATPISMRRDGATGQYRSAGVAGNADPEWTLSSDNSIYYPITPYDFAALYDLTPLWNASTPVDGTGETIAVVGDSDINPADFVNFRASFGLPLGSQTATGTQYLNIIYNGTKPAVQSDEFHADGDTQWASAAAKGAVIDYVASQTTEATSGQMLSVGYIVDNNLAPILVDSYSTCELTLGAAGNAFYASMWQQAAAQGISVVTATGDSGAAACDAFHFAPAQDGAAVNGIASTPYDVAVGGTEFYTPSGPAQYFSASNGAHLQSVSGYIPELVWNDSCTNPVILGSASYGGLSAEQACNGATAQAAGLVTTDGAGGGASSCTSSDVTTPASCSNGYTKPSWQSGAGVPADGVRDLPDVALFASQGRTNSFYVVCQQDFDPDGQACNVNFPYADFLGYGGTELASPAFAGILALVAQQTGGRLGNPNPTLYALAAQQASAGTACNATGTAAASCVFHDVTLGTNAMPCATGSPDCVISTSGDAVGVLSGNAAGAGYDLASGLGSVDAANLVRGWSGIQPAATSSILSVTPSTVVHGQPVRVAVTVTGAGGTPGGTVAIDADVSPNFIGTGTLTNGSLSQTFRNFPGGSYGISAYYSGDASFASSEANFVALTVTPEPSITNFQTLNFNPATSKGLAVSSGTYGTVWYLRADVAGVSGQGIATGNVAISDNGVPLAGGVYRLNSSGYTEAQTNQLTPGTHAFTVNYAGDASFQPSTAAARTLTVSKAPTTAAVSLSSSTVSVAGTISLSATVSTQGFGFAPPSGPVTFLAGSTVLGSSMLAGGTNPTSFYDEGTAVLTLSAQDFPIGPDQISVQYAGDVNYLPSSSSSAPLNVSGSSLTPSAVVVSVTPTTVAPGGSISYAASVSPGSPAPTGMVQFTVDGRNAGAPQTLAAAAVFLQTTTGTLAPGQHTLSASYAGDGTYRSSNAAPMTFEITGPGTAAAVHFAANPTTLVQGTFVSVAVNITPVSPMPTGTAQLVLDGFNYGSPQTLTAGAVTLPLPTATLQVGTHLLTVLYAGDSNFAAVYGSPITLTITAAGTAPALVNLLNLPPLVPTGSPATFVASISPTSPMPAGVVQIVLDYGSPGLPVLVRGAQTPLSIPASQLAPGEHTVQVFYSGDAIYGPASSGTSSFVVGSPAYAGDFTLSPLSQKLTLSHLAIASPLTYTVTPVNGFNAPVAFTCSGLPAYTSCVFSSASVQNAGSSQGTTSLQINFNVASAASGGSAPLGQGRDGLALAGMIAVVLPLVWRRRGRMPRLALLLLGLTALCGINGCGSGYLQGPGVTPMGSYTVTVTATAPNVTHIATINLTVQ